MHKQVSGCTVNFGPNFPESPFLEYQTRKPPPISENFRFGMTKVYSRIPHPHFRKLQIWDDQSLLRITPPFFGKLQIWDDQSLLGNTPHFGKIQIWDNQSLLQNTPHPLPPFQKNSDLGRPKFTPEYPPYFGHIQIWDDQSLLRNTPPEGLRMPRVTTCGDFIQPG